MSVDQQHVRVREMRSAETCLAIIRTRGERRLPIDDLYRQLFNPEFYLQAYRDLSQQRCHDTGHETVDAMSLTKIHSIIDALRFERYRWSPVRRTYIPRRLEAASARHAHVVRQAVQEVMRQLLEAYLSRVQRPLMDSDRAVVVTRRRIYYTGGNVGSSKDIRGCFDNPIIDLDVDSPRANPISASCVRSRTSSGWISGRVAVSRDPERLTARGHRESVLANIYLDRLDTFVESVLRHTTVVTIAKRMPCIRRFGRAGYLTRTGRTEDGTRTASAGAPPSRVLDDPGIGVSGHRYADDFLLGFVGTRYEADG